MKSLWAYVAAAFALIVFVCYSALENTYSIGAEGALKYALLLLLNIYLVFIVISEVYRREAASPLSIFSIAAILQFGLPSILYDERTVFANWENTLFCNESILFTFAFMACFHLAYALIIRPRRRCYEASPHSQPNPRIWDGLRVLLIVATLFIVGWIGRIILMEMGIYLAMTTELAERGYTPLIGTIRQAEKFPDYAAWITFVHYIQIRIVADSKIRTRNWMWLSVVLILVSLAYWIPSGKKLDTLTVIIVPFIAAYLSTRVLPSLKYMIIVAASVAALFPISHMYRTVQETFLTGRAASLTLSEMWDAIVVSVDTIGNATEVGASGVAYGRLGQLEPVAASIRAIEAGALNYRWGEDYFNCFVNLIPTALWSSKPNIVYGNEVAQLFGMIGPQDLTTNISITLPGEAYLNFGPSGALLVGAFMALVYGVPYNVFGGMRSKEMGRIMYAITTPTILYIGASFALYISSLIQTLVFMFVLCWFMEKRNTGAALVKGRMRFQSDVPFFARDSLDKGN